MNTKPYAALLFLLCILLPACQAPVEAPPAVSQSVIFLVRHAEKVDETDASPLTEEGRARAETLAHMLKDAGIQKIYSTDFVRTRETATPTAEELGITIELYDPNKLEVFAEELLASPLRTLVVGHSNTTPDLVGLLGGEPGEPIASQEYDRLYVVLHRTGVETSTILLRYGNSVREE